MAQPQREGPALCGSGWRQPSRCRRRHPFASGQHPRNCGKETNSSDWGACALPNGSLMRAECTIMLPFCQIESAPVTLPQGGGHLSTARDMADDALRLMEHG
jgi:hypothetical protein